MTVEQQHEIRGWLDVIASIRQKRAEASRAAYSLKDVSRKDYDGLDVERFGDITTGLSMVLKPEEIDEAPLEIQMVLNDLGLTSEDQIQAQLILKQSDGSRGYDFVLKPTELVGGRMGILLDSNGSHAVLGGPRSRSFDGIHQTVETYEGKSAEIYENYRFGMGDAQNPNLVEILYSCVKWFATLAENRRKTPPEPIS